MEQTAPTVTLPKSISRTGVHWVRPEIVVESSFTERTKDGMLRHPSDLGERSDKPAKDVVLDRARSPDAQAPIVEGSEPITRPPVHRVKVGLV
jgi:ATP-dependent DNA ligase